MAQVYNGKTAGEENDGKTCCGAAAGQTCAFIEVGPLLMEGIGLLRSVR